ncbi:MAG: UDP-2,3-diacylglucosamine diphosphatase LpxI [Pseudomonadota bacterium]
MTIALIAGTGGVPPHVARTLVAQGRPPILCEMRGFPSEIKGEFTRIPFRIETLGTLLATLKAMNVSEICMVGAVRRPEVDPSAIDAATAPLVPRVQAAMAKGDDGTLRGIVALLEEYGFSIVGAHQIAPDLLPAAGVLTKVSPPDLTNDIAVAVTAISEMGRSDMGQALLVRDGQVIAREDARGTAALLSDFALPIEPSKTLGGGDPLAALVDGVGDLLAGAADWLSGQDGDANQAPGDGAFLYKAPKPGQLRVADMPTIGPETAMKAAEAGLSGIVIAEGGVMVLDLPQVLAILDGQGMFLWVAP